MKPRSKESAISPGAEQYVDFLVAYFDRLSLGFPGSLTLNEIRVNSTIMISSLKGCSYSNKSLSKKLGISKATVSRVTQKLLEQGVYKETVDPDDSRRRVMELTDHGRQQAKEWLDWIESN